LLANVYYNYKNIDTALLYFFSQTFKSVNSTKMGEILSKLDKYQGEACRTSNFTVFYRT